MDSGAGQSSWNQWSNHVLNELQRIVQSNEDLRRGFEEFKLEIARDLVRKSELRDLQSDLSSAKEMLSQKAVECEKNYLLKISQIESQHGKEIALLRSELTHKAGVWSAVAGGVPSVLGLVVLAINYLLK